MHARVSITRIPLVGSCRAVPPDLSWHEPQREGWSGVCRTANSSCALSSLQYPHTLPPYIPYTVSIFFSFAR